MENKGTIAKIVAGIVAAFAFVVGLFFYEREKRKSAESLLDNLDTKKELLEHDKVIKESEVKLKVESDKRDELTKSLEGVEKDVSIKDLEDFFNNSNKQ